MQKYLTVILVVFSMSVNAQFNRMLNPAEAGQSMNFNSSQFNNKNNRSNQSTKKDSVAPVAEYKIISILNDTISVDTAISLKKYYRFNHLRKDEFGILPFVNDGQTYNLLNYGYYKVKPLPQMGFMSKHYNYLEIEDINYYSAPTPYSELYYRTAMEQGQSIEAFISLNINKNLNLFVAYKGLRSLGKYINQLSSAGNFRLGGSYISPNKKYYLRSHLTNQDVLNQENGGIVDLANFRSSAAPYNKRQQLDVYFRDVETKLEGLRAYLNHQYQLNSSKEDKILLTHEFTYEDKQFTYTQPDASIISVQENPIRFGNFFRSDMDNKTDYYQIINRVGAAYQSNLLGRFEFFTEFMNYDYSYKSLASINGEIIPNKIGRNINLFGGKYIYHKDKWKGSLLFMQSFGKNNISNIEAKATYKWRPGLILDFGYQKIDKMPDLSYQLYQSDYVAYNWFNQFKNEKVNQFSVSATTPWLNLSVKNEIITDKLYFSNNSTVLNNEGMPLQLLTTPKQYDGIINYLSIQANKDYRLGKWGLDNTILYQYVAQTNNVLNVPKIVTRSTIHYNDAFFQKALIFQTGITLNYFSSYYANDYNPIIGDFYVQNINKIGNYPFMDFFINLKVRTARIYFKAEHLNSKFTGYRFYSAPNYPYRDFMIRFGLEWNFFS